MTHYYKFNSGAEMLDLLQKGTDLYCADLHLYVFVYNEAGSVCIYHLEDEEVEELRERQVRDGDYWSAHLGLGGDIHDDPSCNPDIPFQRTNIFVCNELHDCGLWEDVSKY